MAEQSRLTARSTDPQEQIKRLRKRLVVLLAGLFFSYLVSFGIAIFLIVDAGVINVPWVWAIIVGFAVLAIVHIRSQFRRYDFLVRMVESPEDEL
jgi:hypothetical protein